MENTKKGKFYSLLVFSLVMLVNPNVNVIDVFPDFIGWFILARLFLRAADSAPYFEEARVAFIRLGILSILKLPAFMLIVMIRRVDTLDNNVYALASLVFAVCEAILLINATRNLFEALFHVGQRTDAVSLITPIRSLFARSQTISVDSIKSSTYLFFVCKCILYFLPNMFTLTRITDRGTLSTMSSIFPIVLVASILIGLFIGLIWFIRIVRYAAAIRNEGKFFSALNDIAREGAEDRFETKMKVRSMKSALTTMLVSSIFTIELAFDNFSGINIFPGFIYGLLLILSIHKLGRHVNINKLTYVFGGGFCLFSLIAFIFSAIFLSSFSYQDLIESKLASGSYTYVQIFSTLEFIFAVPFLIFVARSLNTFILTHTGLSPDSPRYNSLERDYHRSFIKKNIAIAFFGILTAALKFANVQINAFVRLIAVSVPDIANPTFLTPSLITTSALPWFSLIILISAVIYIGVSWYTLSTLKEEVEMKYM